MRMTELQLIQMHLMGYFAMYSLGPTRMVFFVFPIFIYACILSVCSCNKQTSSGGKIPD